MNAITHFSLFFRNRNKNELFMRNVSKTGNSHNFLIKASERKKYLIIKEDTKIFLFFFFHPVSSPLLHAHQE